MKANNVIFNKLRWFVLLLPFAMFNLGGCDYDHYVVIPVVLPDSVSYSVDIAPIFVNTTNGCVENGCHNTGGIPPDLTLESSHESLILYEMVDTLAPENSILYQRIIAKSKPMPPSSPLSQEKIQLILLWIKQGAKNN